MDFFHLTPVSWINDLNTFQGQIMPIYFFQNFKFGMSISLEVLINNSYSINGNCTAKPCRLRHTRPKQMEILMINPDDCTVLDTLGSNKLNLYCQTMTI